MIQVARRKMLFVKGVSNQMSYKSKNWTIVQSIRLSDGKLLELANTHTKLGKYTVSCTSLILNEAGPCSYGLSKKQAETKYAELLKEDVLEQE